MEQIPTNNNEGEMKVMPDLEALEQEVETAQKSGDQIKMENYFGMIAKGYAEAVGQAIEDGDTESAKGLILKMEKFCEENNINAKELLTQLHTRIIEEKLSALEKMGVEGVIAFANEAVLVGEQPFTPQDGNLIYAMTQALIRQNKELDIKDAIIDAAAKRFDARPDNSGKKTFVAYDTKTATFGLRGQGKFEAARDLRGEQ